MNFVKICIRIIIIWTRPIRYFKFYITGAYLKYLNKPIKIYNSLIVFPKKTEKIYLGNYYYGGYEKQEQQFIEKYLQSEDTVLELGGNIGVISNEINRKLKNKGNHVVLEPNPRMIKFLRKNKNLNSAGYKIVEGIISSKKLVNFYISKNILSSSSRIISEEKINPELFLIKDLEKKYSLKFNVLVMDIEGAEIELIEEFDLSLIEKLIIEFHPGKTKESEIKSCKLLLLSYGLKMIEHKDNVEFWKKK